MSPVSFYTQVKIWDIPAFGLQQNLTKARKTLVGHSRRVAIIEWHPTAQNLLLSSAYDYKVWRHTIAGNVALWRFRFLIKTHPTSGWSLVLTYKKI